MHVKHQYQLAINTIYWIGPEGLRYRPSKFPFPSDNPAQIQLAEIRSFLPPQDQVQRYLSLECMECKEKGKARRCGEREDLQGGLFLSIDLQCQGHCRQESVASSSVYYLDTETPFFSALCMPVYLCPIAEYPALMSSTILVSKVSHSLLHLCIHFLADQANRLLIVLTHPELYIEWKFLIAENFYFISGNCTATAALTSSSGSTSPPSQFTSFSYSELNRQQSNNHSRIGFQFYL